MAIRVMRYQREVGGSKFVKNSTQNFYGVLAIYTNFEPHPIINSFVARGSQKAPDSYSYHIESPKHQLKQLYDQPSQTFMLMTIYTEK